MNYILGRFDGGSDNRFDWPIIITQAIRSATCCFTYIASIKRPLIFYTVIGLYFDSAFIHITLTSFAQTVSYLHGIQLLMIYSVCDHLREKVPVDTKDYLEKTVEYTARSTSTASLIAHYV